jgi:POT family proton-dependent oligopeptide transporter
VLLRAGRQLVHLPGRHIVNRDFGGWIFPVGWFQSVNSVAIITLAPILAWMWVKMGKANPSIPRKFGLGLIFNGLAFLLLMFALSSLVTAPARSRSGRCSWST